MSNAALAAVVMMRDVGGARFLMAKDSAGSVLLTKLGPQMVLTCCAALSYVSEMACLRFADDA